MSDQEFMQWQCKAIAYACKTIAIEKREQHAMQWIKKNARQCRDCLNRTGSPVYFITN